MSGVMCLLLANGGDIAPGALHTLVLDPAQGSGGNSIFSGFSDDLGGTTVWGNFGTLTPNTWSLSAGTIIGIRTGYAGSPPNDFGLHFMITGTAADDCFSKLRIQQQGFSMYTDWLESVATRTTGLENGIPVTRWAWPATPKMFSNTPGGEIYEVHVFT